jgi:sugar lactone lactonase YvrE
VSSPDADRLRSRPIVKGLAFPECPRWHDGQLWFSDQHDGTVYRVAADGTATTVVTVPGGASGLGWLPDGAMLVVSMGECRVLRWSGGDLEHYADLKPFHEWHSNDMLVDARGNAYVGSIGFDYYGGGEPLSSALVRIAPDGSTSLATDGLLCPNGMIVTSDGTTLVVAESLAGRLTSFGLGADGALSDRRVFADLGSLVPDGICRDDDDRVLFASIGRHEVVAVGSDGRLEAVAYTGDREVIACTLGGPGGTTLFLCTTVSMTAETTMRNRDGQIEVVELAVRS